MNLIFRQNSCLPDTKTAWGGGGGISQPKILY